MLNLEDQMSVDTEAEKATIRADKHDVRVWVPANRPDQTSVDTAPEKVVIQVEKPEVQIALPPILPDQLNVDAEKAAIRAEKREVPAGLPGSLPENLSFHCVQPYELDSLTHLVRPVSLAVASATMGCALGMIPLVHNALDAVQDLSKVTNDGMLWFLIYAMIFALSSGVSIIAWINAWHGRSDARQLLREIRQRPKIALSQVRP
jgi:hypothetical protein